MPISLLKYLDLPWAEARGPLRSDLETIESSFNQLGESAASASVVTGDTPLRRVHVPHTSIISLPTVAVPLVPSPRVGRVVVPLSVILVSNLVVPYGGINPTLSYLWVRYDITGELWSSYLGDDATTSIPLTHLSDFLTDTDRRRVTLTENQDTSDVVEEWGSLAVSTKVSGNSGVSLVITNGGVNLTGGDPANEIIAYTSYVTLTL